MIKYKIDILEELKKKGYSTYIIRKNKYLSETALTNIRAGKPLPITALESVCIMLRKQPSDIIEIEATDEEKVKYFFE
nr:MAG TPA: helix-turn-helix domain protein [Caudoviricetes sp.]